MHPPLRRHTLADLLHRSAKRHPAKTAIVCGTTEWSYAAFDAVCDRVAAGLAERGVGKGSKVAVLARNSHGFAALRFALARLGAVMVPINFMLKAEEVGYILRHAGAAILVTFVSSADAVRASSASPESVATVQGLIESLGGVPMYMDPTEHDTYAAGVSHLPILMSVALFRMVRDSKGWEDAGLLAGPAFRDLTRLASGEPTMSRDIMETNRAAVIHWLDRYQDELYAVRAAVELGGQPLMDLFTSTAFDRDTYILNPIVRRRPEGPEAPSSQDAIGRLFVGGLYDKLKEMTQKTQTAAARTSVDPELRKKLEELEKR